MIRAGERMEFWYGHWFDCTVVNEDVDQAFEEVIFRVFCFQFNFRVSFPFHWVGFDQRSPLCEYKLNHRWQNTIAIFLFNNASKGIKRCVMPFLVGKLIRMMLKITSPSGRKSHQEAGPGCPMGPSFLGPVNKRFQELSACAEKNIKEKGVLLQQ